MPEGSNNELIGLAEQLKDARHILMQKLAECGAIDPKTSQALIDIENVERAFASGAWVRKVTSQEGKSVHLTFDIKKALSICENQKDLSLVALCYLSQHSDTDIKARDINNIINRNFPSHAEIKNIRTPLSRLCLDALVESTSPEKTHPSYKITPRGIDYVKKFLSEKGIEISEASVSAQRG